LSNLESTVGVAVSSLGLELVELERAPRGLLRVYIDRPAGKGLVTVEDCSTVSHHLSHLFTVENVEYDRLEVSSPGLDRVLKTSADFVRFQQLPVKVRLNTAVDSRKRFEGVVESVVGNVVTFALQDVQDESVAGAKAQKPTSKKRSNAKSGTGSKVGRKDTADTASVKKTIAVELGQIEKARLIPQIKI
jgi:ribosome maturation factor RimP